MITLLVTTSPKTKNLLTKYLEFSGIDEDYIFHADNKDDIELLMSAYEFDLILAEGFGSFLNEKDIPRIDIKSRKHKSSMSKMNDSYITTPIQIIDIKNLVKAVTNSLIKMAS